MISRRAFLESPIIWSAGRQLARSAEADYGRFTPIELGPYATDALTAIELRARGWSAADLESLAALSGGRQQLAGIPFVMLEPSAARRVLLLGGRRRRLALPIGKACHYICLAHFCDRHPDDTEGPFGAENPRSEFEPVGQRLATYTLLFHDGRRHTQPIRRRYEINPPGIDPSHVPAAALPSFEPPFLGLDSPLASSLDFAYAQSAISRETPPGPVVWVYALPSPEPGAIVRTLELEAAGPDLLAICGVTLFHRAGHPLRRLPLRRFEIAVPEAGSDWRTRWRVAVDLGLVARVYPAAGFDAAGWLQDPYRGLGQPPEQPPGKTRLIAEVAAAPDAVLTLEDRSASRSFSYARQGLLLEAGSRVYAEADRGRGALDRHNRNRLEPGADGARPKPVHRRSRHT